MYNISVIIPVYNHDQYVGDAIRSVLDQDYRNVEIIVIDDGSTDNTREVVAQFGDRVCYTWQENRGLSAARNAGIRLANGEFIGLLDADDMYETRYLSTLVNLLDTSRDACAAYCGFRFVNMTNDALPQFGARVVSPDRFYDTLLDGNFLVPECMLVPRDCYRQVGLFDESLRACEDWDMWLRIANRHKVVGTRDSLVRYRILPGSMSSNPVRMLNNRLAVLNKIFGVEDLVAGPRHRTRRRAYGRAYLATTYEYLQYQDLNQAYLCLHKAFTNDPDLIGEFETFYELGCGSQPKGYRGDFLTLLDVGHNATVVVEMLNSFFDDPEIPTELRRQRSLAFANAYMALGLLSYGARQLREARGFLARAIIADRHFALKRQLVLTLAKAFLGARLMNRLSRNTQRLGA